MQFKKENWRHKKSSPLRARIVNLKSNNDTFGAHFTVGNIYENLDKGVYEYTNAILDMSLNELDKGCRFP